MISNVNQITNISIIRERGNSYGTRLPQRVTGSCYVIQSFIFMMFGHMRETHRWNTNEVHYMNDRSISISAHECYNFILKGLTDQVILYSQMCIRKCNITALIFKGFECWGWALTYWNFNVNTIPLLWKKDYN